MDEPNKVNIGVRFDYESIETLRKLSKKSGVPMATIIRRALNKELKRLAKQAAA